MNRDERFNQILEILGTDNSVSAEKISRTLYMSLSTVYRCLREMEQQRLIIRSNGGAMRLAEGRAAIPLSYRHNNHAEQKRAMAEKALKLIPDGASILLDASSTASYIAPLLKKEQQLSVYTNSLGTAISLSHSGIRTVILGGLIGGNSFSLSGKLAYELLEKADIDMAFFSSYGINERGDIIDPSEAETMLRRKFFKKSMKTVFLCDSSKFCKNSIYRLAGTGDTDIIISDKMLPESMPQPKEKFIKA